jgi:hypothetical protein
MLFLLTAVPSTLHIVPDAGIFRMNKWLHEWLSAQYESRKKLAKDGKFASVLVCVWNTIQPYINGDEILSFVVLWMELEDIKWNSQA